MVFGFCLTLFVLKLTNTPSWSAILCKLPWQITSYGLLTYINEIKETVFSVTCVGLTISCWKPKLENKSGAELSNGLGFKIGTLQYILPKFKTPDICLFDIIHKASNHIFRGYSNMRYFNLLLTLQAVAHNHPIQFLPVDMAPLKDQGLNHMEHPLMILVWKFIVWWFIRQVGTRRVVTPTASVVDKAKAFARTNADQLKAFPTFYKRIVIISLIINTFKIIFLLLVFESFLNGQPRRL